MANGLKNVQSHARAFARRERLKSGQPGPANSDDDGLDCNGLDPAVASPTLADP